MENIKLEPNNPITPIQNDPITSNSTTIQEKSTKVNKSTKSLKSKSTLIDSSMPSTSNQTSIDSQNTQKLKFPKLTINTSMARSELPLLKQIIANNKWTEITTNKDAKDVKSADVLWAGLALKPEEFYLTYQTKVNRIPGLNLLAHKKETGQFLNKFQEYFPNDFDFFPKTFLVPEQNDEFLSYYREQNGKGKSKDGGKIFIAKPTTGNKGEGINLINSEKDIPSEQQYPSTDQYVIQHYVDNPLIVDGLKFDLRLYVLITSVSPLVVWLNDQGLVRFCTELYEKPTKNN